MNSSRRSFLRNSAFGLGALAFASPALQSLAAVKYKKLVGVQLYLTAAKLCKAGEAKAKAPSPKAELRKKARRDEFIF